MSNEESQYILGDENTTIDLSFLYQIAEDDTEYIRLMIDTFIETIAPVTEEMAQACASNDWDTLQKKAHYTKSSLSVKQVKQMRDLVVSIEDNCKKGLLLDEMPSKVREVARQFLLAKDILLDYKSSII